MSDDDWEAAAEAVVEETIPVNRWAGEDEEEPVAESWDEDPDERKRQAQAAATANANKPAQGPVLSQRKKKLLEEEEKKRKEKEVLPHTHSHSQPAVFLPRCQSAGRVKRGRETIHPHKAHSHTTHAQQCRERLAAQTVESGKVALLCVAIDTPHSSAAAIVSTPISSRLPHHTTSPLTPSLPFPSPLSH